MISHKWPDNGSGHLREDVFTYYAIGPQTGYRSSQIVDDGFFNLTTQFEYDSLGRMTREIDPRGNDIKYAYNELDQVVARLSREPQLGSTRYGQSNFYDSNDNLVRVDVLNVDEAGLIPPNGVLTTVYEYDVLDYMIRECHEYNYVGVIPGPIHQPTCPPPAVGNGFTTDDYQYDSNRNLVLHRLGEATNGNQPGNEVQTIYDERDLVYQEVRAPGMPDQSTTESSYDFNANLVTQVQGLEGVTPRQTLWQYDGYDRLIAREDPMTNRTFQFYDSNHNVERIFVEGEEFDVPGDAGNLRLSDTTYVYDALDRRIRTITEFFDTPTQLPLSGGGGLGLVIDTINYTDTSQVELTVNDNGNAIQYLYDTANRLQQVVDPKANLKVYTYDPNSNIVGIDETDKDDLLGPDQLFTTTYTYDGLDRRTVTVDSTGNQAIVGYDSRDNPTVEEDALGNLTTRTYDGLDRLTTEDRVLTDTGDGSGLVIGSVFTQNKYDDDSRVTVKVDGNGNQTQYAYDNLGRRVQDLYDDGTFHQYVYDPHHNVVLNFDANGSDLEFGYDLNDRRDLLTVLALGPGVAGTTSFEQIQYDGLDRLATAQDDDSFVARTYDSLSQVRGDDQNGQVTKADYDGVGNCLQTIYPGGRTIDRTFDSLERVSEILDAGVTIATYDYIGPDRVTARDFGNGMRTTYDYDGIQGVPNPAGDSGTKRVIKLHHEDTGGGLVVDSRTYLWDSMQNRKSSVDQSGFGPQLTTTYEYDSVYRMVRETRVDAAAVPVSNTGYQFDGVGNRTNVIGGGFPGGYLMNVVDAPVNQYTQTPFDLRLHDDNGNLLDTDGAGPIQFQYDVRNQFVQGQVSLAGFVSYQYDVLGRRTQEIDSIGNLTRFYYDGWHVVEEQDAAAATLATYVFGWLPDEILEMDRGAQFFYHADDLGSVRAITDAAATVVERYEYSDYGEPSFFDAFWNPMPGTLIDNPYMFTGRRWDEDTGWNYYRTRYMDPRAGRFTTRDTIGIWGDPAEMGNGFSYVGNNPATYVDPFGLFKCVAKLVKDKTGTERIYWGKTWRKYLYSWGAVNATDSGFSMTVSGSAGVYWGWYSADNDKIKPKACVECECVEPGKCRITVSAKKGSVWNREKGVISLAAGATVTYRGDDEVDVDFTGGAANQGGDAVGAGVGPVNAGISFPSSSMSGKVSLGSAKWRCVKQ